MGPAHLAAAGDLLHPGHGDGDAQGVELIDDLGVAVEPGLFEHRQALVQEAVVVIHVQAQDVHGAAGKLGADLHPGNDLEPEGLPRGHGLGQAVHGVVIGEGHGREAPGLGVAHHLRRWIRPVRGAGVDVEVDEFHIIGLFFPVYSPARAPAPHFLSVRRIAFSGVTES